MLMSFVHHCWVQEGGGCNQYLQAESVFWVLVGCRLTSLLHTSGCESTETFQIRSRPDGEKNFIPRHSSSWNIMLYKHRISDAEKLGNFKKNCKEKLICTLQNQVVFELDRVCQLQWITLHYNPPIWAMWSCVRAKTWLSKGDELVPGNGSNCLVTRWTYNNILCWLNWLYSQQVETQKDIN